MKSRNNDSLLYPYVGGGIGALSAAALLRNRAINEMASKSYDAGHPVVLAGTMSPELGGGSGEAKTGYKLLKLLRQRGVNAVFAPTRMPQLDFNDMWGDAGTIDGSNMTGLNKFKYRPQNRITRTGADAVRFSGRPMGDVLIEKLLMSSGAAGRKKLAEIKSLSAAEQRTVFNALLSKDGSRVFKDRGLEEFNTALRKLESGAWNDWSIGRIYTILKVGGLDAINHPEYWMHPNELATGLKTGNIASVLSLERGFKWSTIGIDPEKLSRIYETDIVRKNKFNPAAYAQLHEYRPYSGGTVNLGVPTNFKINYDSPSDNLIPGITAEKPPATPEEARKLFNDSRKDLVDAIHEIRAGKKLPAVDLAGRDLIFMSAGSAGPGSSSKLRYAVDALDKLGKNYHIFLQSGTTLSKDLPEVVKELERKNPGRITWTDYIGNTPTMTGSQRISRFANGADLYFTYGGSSTASEAGAITTPMIFTSDWGTNLKNSNFIIGKRGDGLIAGTDNRLVALDRVAKRMSNDPSKYGLSGHDMKKWTDSDWRTVFTKLKNESKVDFDEVLDRKAFIRDFISGKSLAENSKRNFELVRQMLSDETKKFRFSEAHLKNVGNYHSNLEKATEDFVNTVRNHHEIGKASIGRSGPGVSGLNRRLGSMLTKNPALTKAAPLAILAGTSLGVGAGLMTTRKRNKNKLFGSLG